ncbi:iron chelate uptake ABC transporter family permease subunit [Kribbella sandramycini]|uniref:Iron chelate uptake ABC transporter family permease subunit n=1 Tax=Kribbella sandramycini TaxID=60450 RepID=A0A7Y4L4Y7_9ACTN|nr:iron complex transport system permease protein [Kribbella sandramycini]NOL43541.1 iron chelate uptake ABC transporter family permease subunit [Kribbella sandramycini]
MKSRTVVLSLVFAALAVGIALLSLSIGTSKVPVGDVVEVLLGGGRRGQRLIVLELRLPRVATGLLVGIAFAVSGALLQTLSRNALASPDVVGVNSGASAGAVAVIVLAGTGGGNISGFAGKVGIPLAAILGGLLATVIVGVLSIQRGQVDGGKVVLIGVGIAAAANSLVAWMLVIGDVNDAGRAAAWLAGSLNARAWSDAVPVLIAVVVLLPVAILFNRDLSAMVLGDDVASSLGVRVARIRLLLLIVATLLAAMATAGAGPIAFVALVAPQVALRLTRMERPPLVTTALLGAVFVVLADLVARNGLGWLHVGPYELPVGVITAAAGAPYLLHLIGRQQRGR